MFSVDTCRNLVRTSHSANLEKVTRVQSARALVLDNSVAGCLRFSLDEITFYNNLADF